MKKEISGFTLVELLITLTVLSITVNFVVPSFDSLIRSYKLRAETNNLIASLYLAKSEAIKRNQTITIGVAGAKQSRWEEGWQIYTDVEKNGNTDFNPSEDKLIKKIVDVKQGIYIASNSQQNNYISFRHNGMLAGAQRQISFYVCGINENDKNREVMVSLMGRPSVKTIGKCPV
ncbi:GspH/FimT family pseudopilin [Endozoicomonas sp. SM1973]|uniref:Type II secretion system protein H n=1 Tax=Spartinivicinus marinus TaxID=2994442 RepID=A0A853I5Q6_9GAMM|nr:GspH/FimT family pseudopilin [Spartinivicinus marinus]MCX4026721.1 GspH/FimT family pseudopilin [Spartinivicinus marinus]NYZ64555.1 GspH/FimT family pseudopilin [Spartinivicinus marinus]